MGKARMLNNLFKLALSLLLVLIGMGAAQAGYYVYTSGVYSPPSPGANLYTIDFGTRTLATEQTASRLTYSSANGSGGFLTSGGSVSYTSSVSESGFSGNAMRISSGTTNNATTVTVNFAQPTPYVGLMWRAQFTSENSQILTLTLSDGTTKVLKNCTSSSNNQCVGMYVDDPSWLTSVLNFLLGWLLGDAITWYPIYVQYTPDSGVKVSSMQFKLYNCGGCGFLSSDTSQDWYVDNISYIDAVPAPHHLELTTGASSVSANSATTFRIKACGDATCSTPYVTGTSGTIGVSGVTATYTAAWSIPAGPTNYVDVTVTPTTAGTATLSLPTYSPTPSNTPKVFCGMGTTAASGNACNMTVIVPLHHVNISASSGLTCTPRTYTVQACADASCATPFTSGLSGTLAVSGSGMTVNYPSGAGFSIPNGSSSTTVSVHATTVGSLTTATLSSLSSTPTASPSVYCGMNGAAPASGGSCTISLASSGLLFDVPNHRADASQSVTVSAVQSSNNATACTPAFASVSKNVTFKCSYSNPSSGTSPVRVGGVALNTSNNSAAACDGTGHAVSLSFNASGVATTTVQYADVGQVGMTATYTGSGTDAGLSMTGSDSFIAAPYIFSVVRSGSGNIAAGGTFSATVSALNVSNAVTPNFGRESSAEGVSLSWVRTQPAGSGAVNGSFSGSVGAFSSGVATASNLSWTEVGQGDVAAALTDAGNDGYLGTGMKAAGSSTGWLTCGAEGGTCTLPTGATAYVAYGANGAYNVQSGLTGSVACTNAVFGDPIVGVAKTCYYVVTSGASTGATGGFGPFVPHHFDVSLTSGCGSFTYGGQPFSAQITARNAAGSTTVNYDGSVNTTPNFAKAGSLSAVGAGAATGSLSSSSFAISQFSQGVATLSSTPVFSFTNKLTSATTVTLRATDSDAVSSSNGTDGSLSLRSGRIKISNSFGTEKTSLSVPVQVQYWNGKAWVINSQDSCTSIPATAVVRSNYLDHKGAVTTAWSTTPTSVTISGGNGTLTLSAPTGGITGSVDFAFNLGAGASDQSCLGSHPSSTGASLPWLRAQNGTSGGCAGLTSYDRDPSARATFGVYQPETKKSIFQRDLY